MVKEIFLGTAIEISKMRDKIDMLISINDGFYNIDSERISYRIKKGSKFEVERNMKAVEKLGVPGIDCYGINLEGTITIPSFLVCEHSWKEGSLKSDNITLKNDCDELYDQLVQVELAEANGSIRFCAKCQRVEIINPEESSCDSGISNYNRQIHQTPSSYNKRFEDCNFEILQMIILELCDNAAVWIDQYLKLNKMKLVAMGLPSAISKYSKAISFLRRKLWLELDAFPCLFKPKSRPVEMLADSFARKSARLIGFNNLLRLEIGPSNIVAVDSNVIEICGLRDYQNYLSEFPGFIKEVRKAAEQLSGNKIVFISSTPQGGGVALMRHAHIRFYRHLGMQVSWFVTIPVARVYNITKKKFHNILQGVTDEELTFEEKRIYEDWVELNCQRFWNDSVFREADIIVLDDHQTSGFVKHIKSVNKKVKIIYRSHIQIRNELLGTRKNFGIVCNYIAENLKGIDLFIAHPVKSFVPAKIDTKKVIYLPPSTDPLDGLNKNLTGSIEDFYFEKLDEICKKAGVSNLRNTPYIIQIARFDPSKGLKDVIKSFLKLLNRIKDEHQNENSPLYNLKLVIAGHGSVDDPEGSSIYAQIVRYVKKTGCKNIICLQIPPCDQLLNVLLSNALICLQLSVSEGFEIKVSEVILKNIPVIVYDVGGIPLQVIHGVTGYIVRQGDTGQVASYMEFLLKTPEFRVTMKNYIVYSKIYTTPFQILAWLQIFQKALNGENGDEEFIYDKLRNQYFMFD